MQSSIIEDNNYNNLNSWVAYLATLGVSTAGGLITGGMLGGAIGLSTAIIDEYLINRHIADKHYLTASSFWANTALTPLSALATKLAPTYSIAIKAGSYALSSLIAWNSSDFLDFKTKVTVPLDSFVTINNLFDNDNLISTEEIYNKFFENPLTALGMIKQDLQNIYQNEFLYNYLSIILLSSIEITADMIMKNLFVDSGKIFTGSLDTVSEFKLLTLFPAVMFWAFSREQLNSANKKQFLLITEKSTDILIEKGNGIKVLSTDKGKEIISNLNNDLSILLSEGANNLNSLIFQPLKALFALKYMIGLSPNAVLLNLLCFFTVQTFMKEIFISIKDLSEKLAEPATKILTIKSDISDNIGEINLRDGEEFVREKYYNLLAQENAINQDLSYLINNKDIFEMTLLFLSSNIVFNIIDKKSNINILHLSSLIKKMEDFYYFICSNLNFSVANQKLIIAKDRVEKFFEIISFTDEHKVHRTENEDNKVIFHDYILKLDGNVIVKIDHLEFLPGRHYAITGKSGCGKTSTLIDLKGGISSPLSSSGEISLADKSAKNYYFIDQKVYLPKESTLLESIYFPSILKNLSSEELLILRNQVITLFRELEIDGFTDDTGKGLVSRLDSQEFKLSGGQAKKIAIIQAILNKPDILIMDETCTGLDQASLIKSQQILNKYLPNSMILSVDHHARDNNYNGFYDFEVHFGDGITTFNDIATRSDHDVGINYFTEEIPLTGELYHFQN